MKINEEQKKAFLRKFNFEDVEPQDKFNERKKFNLVKNFFFIYLKKKKISEELLGRNNTIRLYISDKYDIYEMPGYLTIPYNYDMDELKKFFFENKFNIFKIKEKVKFCFNFL